MPSDHLNVRQTAGLLSVSEATVRNWANRGVLHPVRLPGSGYRRFDRTEVEALRFGMAQQAQLSTAWLRRRITQYRPTLDYLRDH
jgi:excisionase family DNA binding protein